MYPTIRRRYMSTLIDGLVVFAGVTILALTLQSDRPPVPGLRIGLIFAFTLGYEPLLTSRWVTIGQYLTGIRIRRADDITARIGVPQAYLRWVVKILLGMLSFFSVEFNEERRALHDLASGSVVVFAKTSKGGALAADATRARAAAERPLAPLVGQR